MAFHEWLFEWSNSIAPLMANHLWQATLFSLAVFIAARFLGRWPARVRHALWLMASLKFVLPSDLFLLLLHRAGVDFGFLFGAGDISSMALSRALQIVEPVPQIPEPLIEGPVSALTGLRPGHAEIFCALAVVWSVGSLLMLSLWCWKRFQVSSALEERRGVESERVSQALARARARLGMKRRVKLVISPESIEPGIWRVWSPVLALPADLSDHLSDDELDAMLMHELVHISRWDNLVSNLNMMVCCIFWFHPVVWLIDRRLLSERESSCDERVLELGVSSRVYAASLLKVLRFCVGWRVAGVSAATGSNLPRRVDLILAFRASRKSAAAPRLLIGSFAAAVLVFTLATGLLVQSDAVAQSLRAPRAAKPELAGGAEEPVPALAPRLSDATPLASGQSPLSREEMRELMKKAENAPFTSARFRNLDGAPVVITDAKVKVISRERELSSGGEGQGGAYELLIMPRLALTNNTNRRIAAVYVKSEIAPSSFAVTTNRVNIGPAESVVLQVTKSNWSEILPVGSARKLILSVARVVFEDGSAWGLSNGEDLEPALAPSAPEPSPEPSMRPDGVQPAIAPPPDAFVVPERETLAPAAARAAQAAEYIPARFENPTGTPLIIYSAVTDASAALLSRGGAARTGLPVVTLINASDRRIVAIKLRFKADADEHAVSAFRVSLDPGGSFTYRSDMVISGSASFMNVQVIGAQFEDGSIWGSMTSRINSRDDRVQIPLSIRKSEE